MTEKSAPTSLAWMPLYITDTLRLRSGLSATQFGALVSLKLHAWDEPVPCTLPDNDARLAVLAGMSAEEWRENGEAIREYLTPTAADDKGRPRLVDLELQKLYGVQLAKYITASTNGRKGGRPPGSGKAGEKQMEKLGESSAFVGLRNSLSSELKSSLSHNTEDAKEERKLKERPALRPGEKAMIDQERAWQETHPGEKLPLDFHCDRRTSDRRQAVTS